MRSTSLGSVSLAALLMSAAAGASTDKVFDRQVAAQPRGVVDISNVSGSIEVSGWDRPEVSVHAELGAGVERIDVNSEGGRTVIKVVLSGHSGHDGETHLHVQIPQDSELDVSAVSADVTSAGVLGMQRLSVVSGEVTAELAGSDLELKTVSGDVRLKGHGQPARLHVSTVSGDVHLEHGAGDLEAGSVSGTLVVSLDSARTVRARTTSGDLRFQGRLTHGADFDASTVSGDLDVRTSAEGGYAYELKTFSGDIRDCFDAHPEHSGKFLPGSTLQGTRGEGAGHVRLKTMSGDIQLCDRN
jgi:Putative adhesin